MLESDIPLIGVDIYTPDLQAVGRGYGCEAVRARSLNQLVQVLREAQASNGPTLIEIHEDDARHW